MPAPGAGDAPVAVERRGPLAVLTMARGPVNALDVELLEALVSSLAELEDSDARAVVLTGAGRAFCAGVDLRRLVDEGAPYAERLLPALSEAFVALFATTLPVVAAVNGHAIAGGCVLACAADVRVMASGGPMIGASELAVGVPFPVSALEVLRHALGPAAEEAVLTGALHPSDQARARGLVHEVVAPEALVGRAVEVAERLGAMAPAPYRLAKRQLRAGALRTIRSQGPELDPEVVAFWSSDTTIDALRRYLEQHVGRPRRPPTG